MMFKFIFFLFTVDLFASEKLGYLQSNLLRLAEKDHVSSWFFPANRLQRVNLRNPNYLNATDMMVFGHSEFPELIEDLQSKNDKIIEERVNRSFGEPFEAAIKVKSEIMFNKDWSVSISSNAAEVFILNNPVLPTLDFFIYQDFNFGMRWTEFSLVAGRRRSLNKKVDVVDVLNKSQNLKIGQLPWYSYINLSYEKQFDLEVLDLNLNLDSIPVISTPYEYWQSNISLKSKNLISYFYYTNVFLQFSPVYSGSYVFNKTIKFGPQFMFSKYIGSDIVFDSHFNVSYFFKALLENFEFDLYVVKSIYDDFYFNESRTYGLNFRFQF